MGSFGKVNTGSNVSSPEEFKENKEQAKHRHNKLKALIERKEALRMKLTRRFRLVYFMVRLGFIGLLGAYIFVCFQLQWVQNPEDILYYSEAFILVVVALNFLTFGTLTSLNAFINLIKIKLENWIWGKYANIAVAIEMNKTELNKIALTTN